MYNGDMQYVSADDATCEWVWDIGARIKKV